jgi:hypothetical protein
MGVINGSVISFDAETQINRIKGGYDTNNY